MQEKIKKDAIFLIDGSSILYRAYYALGSLKTSSGIPVQAIYGFCRTIKKLIDDFNPTKMVLVWDSKGKTFRSEIYEKYKETRQATPSDLITQKNYIIEFADLIGLLQISKPGLEADDLIASLADEYKKDNQIIIVSQDKDLRQLIDNNQVLVYDPLKKELIDEEKFKEENIFEPKELLLYYSLLGDASDNIPGVAGIGKKTAQDLTIQYKTLSNLYKNISEIKKEKVLNALQTQKEEAVLSEQLFRLKIEHLRLPIQSIEFNKTNLGNALPFFENLEFKSLIAEFGKYKSKEKKENEQQQVQQLIEEKPIGWNYIIIDDLEKLEDLAKKLKEHKLFAVDTETSGLSPLTDEFAGISVALDSNTGYYIPCAHKNVDGQKQLNIDDALKILKPILESDKIHKILHHAKFDQLVLWKVGIEVRGVTFDTLIAAYLLKTDDQQKIGLKFLSKQFFNEPMLSYAEVTNKKYKDFSEVPIDLAARYSAHDSLQTYKIKFVLENSLEEKPNLKKAFEEIEMPTSQVLFRMERYGVLLNPEILKELNVKVKNELEILENKILSVLHAKDKNSQINLNSPKQLEQLLFDELNLPVIKKSPTGARSTSQEVLSELSKLHAIPGMVLKYRELFKLRSTYIEPLPHQINPYSGRIHTTYSQTDVITGRLSSSNPNLQNIPTESEYGTIIRSAFIAPENKLLLSADYSQIELRVLAHLSGDKNLITAFRENKDIHAQTAAQIFGVSAENVTNEQRQIGKRINFSIIYGLTPYGLSKELGIKPNQAKEYITRYFERYSKIGEWMDQTVENAKKVGYVETLFGRRRYIPQLHEKNRTIYEQARRVAINTPVQGTSAEIIKLAMIEIDKICIEKNLKTQMIMQIHDELVLEVPVAEKDIAEKLVISRMENIVQWQVPIKVAIRIGKNWAEVSK